MEENALPIYASSGNPTNCCPRFNPDGWDDQHLHFKNKLFVKTKTKSVMHVPINMGKVFQRTFEAIESADAIDPEQFIVLSRDASPWSGEHYFSVTKDVPGQTMANLTGDYYTKVFEGPYKNAREWREALITSVSDNANTPPETLFFHTTCPKCAKYYGKNYVVGLVQENHEN